MIQEVRRRRARKGGHHVVRVLDREHVRRLAENQDAGRDLPLGER